MFQIEPNALKHKIDAGNDFVETRQLLQSFVQSVESRFQQPEQKLLIHDALNLMLELHLDQGDWEGRPYF